MPRADLIFYRKELTDIIGTKAGCLFSVTHLADLFFDWTQKKQVTLIRLFPFQIRPNEKWILGVGHLRQKVDCGFIYLLLWQKEIKDAFLSYR